MSETPTIPGIDLAKSIDLRPGTDPVRERARIAQLAQEFEAMLMLQMVRGMRQSLLDEPDDEGLGRETLSDTFDVELTRHLAAAGGFGLGALLTSQMAARSGGEGGTPAGPESSTSGTVGLPTASDRASFIPFAGPSALDLASARASAVNVSQFRHNPGDAGRATDTATDTFRLSMPLGSVTTSAFGWRPDPLSGREKFHRGVDLRAAYGTDVPAAADGEVVFAGPRGSYGNVVILKHADGVETRYAHLSNVDVSVGETVPGGGVVGRVGSSGRSTAPHLHFEVLVNGERVDPERVAARLGRGPLKLSSQADD
jgi:Rod binding domain-containing protein